jgi:hypothetical protein
MPHNEGYYYAAYLVAMSIYMLYTISLRVRRQSVAMRRLSLGRDR